MLIDSVAEDVLIGACAIEFGLAPKAPGLGPQDRRRMGGDFCSAREAGELQRRCTQAAAGGGGLMARHVGLELRPWDHKSLLVQRRGLDHIGLVV